jgi:hypothetical protein
MYGVSETRTYLRGNVFQNLRLSRLVLTPMTPRSTYLVWRIAIPLGPDMS